MDLQRLPLPNAINEYADFLNEKSRELSRLNGLLEDEESETVKVALYEEVATQIKQVRGSCIGASDEIAHQLIKHGVSERRTAFLLGVSTTTVRKWRSSF